MIRDELQQVFRNVFEDDTLEIHDEMTAADVEKWDSLAHITLVVEVERHFKVKFKNAEIARLQDVGDLLRLVEKYRAR